MHKDYTLIDRLTPNPNFGSGRTIRRVRLSAENGYVTAHLVDILHEIECVVSHDGDKVVGVEGRFIRFPTNLCPGSASILSELVGTPLNIDSTAFYSGGRARGHCTHLYDLAALAIAHANREERERLYEAIVPDVAGLPVTVEAYCNGDRVHAWTVKGDQIVAPDTLAGRSLMKGFFAWASAAFEGAELEAASVLAKTCFVSGGRRFAAGSITGIPLEASEAMIGSCYAYAPSRVQDGIFLGHNQIDIE